uniref:Uncharacterized protein n=1 Tax=Clytia hemisphaerica TaxID=252671 RepID=A0A7M5UQM6_9CNID
MAYGRFDDDGINCSLCACSCLILPMLLTISATLVVFVGGINNLYTMDIRIAIGIMLAVFNVLTFLLFACDKASAMSDGLRAAELVLLYMAWFGSPVGALMGICCCNHKTAKGGFILAFICVFLFNMLWVFLYFILTTENSLADAFNNKVNNSTI